MERAAAKTRKTLTEWDAVREQARDCRSCDLWRPATQTVFGEGPVDAPLMLVGEQPGDREDIAGKPFVGPAGRILDRALAEAGIARDKAYVTNAVKHFKFVRRGKIRLHQKPDTAEIRACQPWLARTRDRAAPADHRPGSDGRAIGLWQDDADQTQPGPYSGTRWGGVKALITVHPSYLLRVEEADKEREYGLFVADLRLAAPFAR